ncbi:hypothetical protein [Legionella hackeliae]|uniref:Purine NTPase n=1 Tax=Legionella hackeliae TaxID=449 RepID=A0A0A8UXE1_LEGHA|nr:hypothetical protein [Legionella hackeliae]KTD15211.1 purine NTPase [Legionella hackeliae]CEK11424.1 protein of unknown function [Legionella hackeliae]STX48196.1 purine NTPase, putative [Legionella hackeliae]
MKEEQFKQFFTEWRKEAPTEQKYLFTALLILSYIERVNSIDTIKTDLVDSNSNLFKNFDTYKGRSFGVALYGRLAVQSYLGTLDSEEERQERELLSTVMTALSNLYTAPTQATAENFNLLTTNMESWLDNYAMRNPQRAKTLLPSLYIVLKTVAIALEGLPGAATFFANCHKVNIDSCKIKIHSLLVKTEKVNQEIDQVLVPPSDSSAPKNVTEYFNREFLSILSSTEPLENKLAALELKLEQVKTDTTNLLQAKKAKRDLEEKETAVKKLLDAAIANEQQITGQKYFLELIALQKSGYDFLVASPQGKELLQKANSLSNPNEWEQLYDAIQYGISWATSATTALYRLMTPKNVQENIVTLFATRDSECKNLLKISAKNYLVHLTETLNSATETLNIAKDVLAAEQNQLKTLISRASEKELNEVCNVIDVIKNAVIEYRQLVQLVQKKQPEINTVIGLNKSIDAFIAEHNTLWVKLCNLLASLLPVFKTEMTQMIDEVNKFKVELHDLTAFYRETLARPCEFFDNAPDAASPLRKILTQTITLNFDANLAPQLERLSAPSAFELIKTTFAPFKNKTTYREEIEEQEISSPVLE